MGTMVISNLTLVANVSGKQVTAVTCSHENRVVAHSVPHFI